jgi:hypothetical protein
MTDVTPIKAPIQQEQVAYRMPVSENLMNQMGESINYALKAAAFLGQAIHLALTEIQFAAIAGFDPLLPESEKPWVIMKGQSIVGSDYYSLTGIATLPNALSNEAFLGQLNSGSMLQSESSQNKNHNHPITQKYVSTGGNPTYQGKSLTGRLDYSEDGEQNYGTVTVTGGITNITPEGGSVAKPNTVRINIFLKINN